MNIFCKETSTNPFSFLTSEGKKNLKKQNNGDTEKKKEKKEKRVKEEKGEKDVKKKNVQKTQKEVQEVHKDVNAELNNVVKSEDIYFDFDIEKKTHNSNIEKGDTIIERDINDGKNNYLNSYWTVWVHRNDCEDWSIASYQNIFTIDSIASFWDFFNYFHMLNKEENQYFIMRNKIKPKWEDNNNRNGGICSLKMDCYDRNSFYDVGCEIMMCLCILIMNETLIQDGLEINGVSYSVKSRNIYIKIWTKEFKNSIVEKLPKNIINKFNSAVRSNSFRRFENNISIRYTEIKPEHDDE